MNIFQLDLDPVRAAQYHTDKHVVKMIVEYAQLLSTAHRVITGSITTGVSKTGRKQTRYILPDNREHIMYSATHINHPSAVWVRDSETNYRWLHSLLVALSKEYTYRYGKVHKCERDGLISALDAVPAMIPRVPGTPLRLAMPDEYRVLNPVEAYRKYVKYAKPHLHAWKLRQPPDWLETV